MTTDFSTVLTATNAAFLGIGLIGLLGHAVKKYLSNELKGSIIDYLIYNNPHRSALAVLTTLGACLAVILGDQVPAQIGALAMLAFTTGFTADSSVNKDTDPN